MTQPNFDAVVIGAGIAGPCAAVALARRGARVALLETGELPRHKVCGEFLSPESQAVFTRLGIMELIQTQQPVSVGKSRIVAASGKQLETELPQAGLALSRFRLDKTLWDAAATSGAYCYAQTRVRHIEGNATAGFTVTTTNETFTARAVIAAPGRHAPWLNDAKPPDATNSKLKTQNSKLFFGMKAHFRGASLEPGVVELHGWRGGYCGVTQVEDGITNVCLLARYEVLQSRAERAPGAFWEWLLAQCPSLALRMQGATRQMAWLTTGNVAFGACCPASGDVLRCGDAAGFIDPLTGDGMAMAARSGELAATVTALQLRGDVRPHDAAPLYAAAWQREFKRRLHWAAALRPLLMTPGLTTPAIALLSHTPGLAQRIVANTRGL